MSSKAAGPERPSPGGKRDSPDQATATGRAKPGDSAGQRDKVTPAGEAQDQFREALERKRAREAGNVGAPRAKDTGKIHGAHGPSGTRRSFRRKSG